MPPQLLEAPPMQPAEVTGQQGSPDMPFSGVGAMMADKGGPEVPTAAHPQGALMAKASAIKKVLETMVQEANGGKPYFSRMLELMDQGLAAESKGGGSGGADQMNAPPGAEAGKPPSGAIQSPAFPG